MSDYWSALPTLFWRLDDNHNPVRCVTMEEYFASAEKDPHVADTEIADGIGVIRVSTVFLHSASHRLANPEFFETMVFGGPLDQFQCRYQTWDEAAAGHQRLCDEIGKLLALSPAELEAEMASRKSERFRFLRETALALGLPRDLADRLGQVANEKPDP